MNLPLYISRQNLRGSFRKLLEPRPGKLLQLASYLFALTLFLAGGYLLFHRLFAYLLALEDIGRSLLFRLLSSSFLTFFIMLFLSNLITSLSTLFRSREVDFLLSTPLPSRALFEYSFYKTFFYSSWATLILGLPLTVALLATLKAGPWGILLGLALLPPFVAIPAALAVSLLLVAVRVFPRLSLRHLLAGLLAFLALASWTFFAFARPQGLSISQINTMPELENYMSSLAVVTSPLLPSTWITEGLMAGVGGGISTALGRLWLLAITALFLTSLCYYLSQRFYLNSLTTRVTGSPMESYGSNRRLTSWWARKFPIAAKDSLLFLRDPTQWAQGLIFISLLVIYLGSLRRYPMFFTFPMWKVVITFINFAFAGYILATLSVRFVFPVISLEGPTLWFIKSSPIKGYRLFAEKAFVSIIVALVLTESLSLISNQLLHTMPGLKVISHVSLGLMCLVLTSLTLGLGAMIPDFKERNPSKIASGLGGLLAALAGLAYVALSIVVLAWPAYLFALNQWRSRVNYGQALVISFGIFLLLSGIAMYLPLKFGLKRIKEMQV
jgi:ABC-2 type transport system permease protein